MIMLSTLQTYYEFTGDKRVISLMTRYFKWQLSAASTTSLRGLLGEQPRGRQPLHRAWLYNRTRASSSSLQLAEKIHRNTADWHQNGGLPNWHNVNIAECFREPATHYMLTGDKTMLQASYDDQELVRRTCGQVPGGMFGGDENCRMGRIDPGRVWRSAVW